jgi:Flp pilus assembly protein TadG
MATLTMARVRAARGQAVIEMALTLPLLLLIVLGIFDFGFMFQRYEVVTNAAREGARLGVLADYTEAEAEQRALAYLTTSGINPTVQAGPPCDYAETPRRVCADLRTDGAFGTATLPGTGGGPAKTVQQVTMIVQYDHEHVFVGPILRLFGGTMSTVRLRAVSTMRRE